MFTMAILPQKSVVALPLLAGLLSGRGFALQVTPNSPCAAKCLDSSNQNVTDTSTSDTSGSDIVCRDSDYSNTKVGQKYEACVSCLQSSAATGDGQNDQEWFLYNLRYSLDTCLFGFANSSDSSSPGICSMSTSCGPLQTALEDGNLIPSNESAYSYCSADSNSIKGSYYSTCVECLRSTTDQTYLANFLSALSEACSQQPTAGVIIGLEGTVFSSVPVNGTHAGFNQTSTTSTTKTHKKALSQVAVIGIVVMIVVLLAIAAAVIFSFYRKQLDARRLKALQSPLDSRFGAANITSPTSGAYADPYSRQINQAAEPFDPDALSKKELTVLSEARSVIAKHLSTPRDGHYPEGWQDAHSQLAIQLPEFTGAVMPTHQAYIPSQRDPISPAESSITDHTYYASSHSSPGTIPRPSSRTSPRNIQPTGEAPQPTHEEPLAIQPPQEPDVQHNLSTKVNHTSPSLFQQPVEPPPPSRTRSIGGSWMRSHRHVPPLNTQVQQSDSSRIYSAGPHSAAPQSAAAQSTAPQSAVSQTQNSRPPSRAASFAESWRRGTRGLGIGNANASAEVPIEISGPITQHPPRFDFEMADRERKQRERREKMHIELKRLHEPEPDSANSDDLW